MNMTGPSFFENQKDPFRVSISSFRIWALLSSTSLAECERLPFDLPEAEEELVAGYQTEYSGIKYALFYLASYLNLLVSSLFITVLYLGGWNFSIPYIYIPELFGINKMPGVFGMTIDIFITLAKAYLFLF